MNQDKPPPDDIELVEVQYEDEADAFDHDDDGNAALLGAEGRTRGIERTRWRQVSGLVLEVRRSKRTSKGVSVTRTSRPHRPCY